MLSDLLNLDGNYSRFILCCQEVWLRFCLNFEILFGGGLIVITINVDLINPSTWINTVSHLRQLNFWDYSY